MSKVIAFESIGAPNGVVIESVPAWAERIVGAIGQLYIVHDPVEGETYLKIFGVSKEDEATGVTVTFPIGSGEKKVYSPETVTAEELDQLVSELELAERSNMGYFKDTVGRILKEKVGGNEDDSDVN